MTRFEAQRKLGLFAAHDYVMLAFILFTLFVTVSYIVFSKASLVALILAALVLILLLLAWLVVLAYRIMVFVLDLHAEIALLPQAAARIAAGYFEGRIPVAARK